MTVDQVHSDQAERDPWNEDRDAAEQAAAARVRRRIVEMCASRQGGHLGGSLSLVEILLTLYQDVMRVDPAAPRHPGRDIFLLSKGHGALALYAVLAECGHLPESAVRSYGAPDGTLLAHPVPEPHGPAGVEAASGSLGHGLALGVGYAMAMELDGAARRCFVVLGDGELQEGSVWEAAMAAGARRLGRLVAVVDRNGLQITGPTERVVDVEPLAAKWAAFGWAVREVDGHDRAALRAVLGDAGTARASAAPTLVLARTVKGKGLPYLENRVHSHFARLGERQFRRALSALGAPTPAPTPVAPAAPPAPAPPARSARDACRDVVVELLRTDERYVCLDSDTGMYQGVDFGPAADRYINVGIAEQNLMGAAAGLARSGRIPLVHTMAAFAAARALESVKIDLAFADLPCVIVATHGGLSAGSLGPTHHALEDVAVMRLLPHLRVVVPADADSAARLLRACAEEPGPCYLRLGRAATPDLPADAPPARLGRAQILRASGCAPADVLLAACGPHPVHACLRAADELAVRGLRTDVVNLHTVKPLDVTPLEGAAAAGTLVVAVEEHWAAGGLGSAIAEHLAAHAPARVLRIAAPDRFLPLPGDQERLLEHAGITASAIVDAVCDAIRATR